MKIISQKQAPPATSKWWAGEHQCAHCGTTFLLEPGDAVLETNVRELHGEQRVDFSCPGCGNPVHIIRDAFHPGAVAVSAITDTTRLDFLIEAGFPTGYERLGLNRFTWDCASQYPPGTAGETLRQVIDHAIVGGAR